MFFSMQILKWLGHILPMSDTIRKNILYNMSNQMVIKTVIFQHHPFPRPRRKPKLTAYDEIAMEAQEQTFDEAFVVLAWSWQTLKYHPQSTNN